ncbi:MAG: LTA synthase family protein [Bacteroidales bacterium]|nr:LTA synthase family protein [Bacteroidales bacterium]
MSVLSRFKVNEYVVVVYRFALLMLIYSLLRVCFWLMNADLFPDVTWGDMQMIMVGGMRFDVSALIYLNILFFVMYLLSFRAKQNRVYRKIVDAVFFSLNGFGILLNCIDLVYYRFILKRTTFNVIDILGNESNWCSLIAQMAVDYWYVVVVFAVAMALFIVGTRRVEPVLTPIKNNVAYAAIGVVVVALIATLSVAGIRGGFRHSTRPITLSNAAAYVSSPEESWIVLNTPFCVIRTIGKKSFVRYEFFEQEELEQVFTPCREGRWQTSGDSRAASDERKNVVIFILESFSREFLGRFNKDLEGGGYRGYTPFLDSLAEHSMIYTNAYANGRKSIDAMPSVLASIPSLTMPYVVSEYSNNRINSIASLLGEEGYQTAFFHGAPNGSMGFDAFARIASFGSYVGRDEYGNDEDFDGMWGIWDDKFMSFYADELSKMKEPFCTALFSLSSHHPYKVPERYEGKFRKGVLPLEECIGYTDHSLRLFFEKAKREEWFDNTLFVITADHSITPEHDEYKNNAMAFAVPIMFYCHSDSTLVGEDVRLAQQADIMPSVLSYLGYEKPYVAFGVDLFDEKEERFVVNYLNGVYQIMVGDVMAYFDGERLTGVFDRKRDPMLLNDIKDAGDYGHIENKIKAYIQQYDSRMIDNRLTASKE